MIAGAFALIVSVSVFGVAGWVILSIVNDLNDALRKPSDRNHPTIRAYKAFYEYVATLTAGTEELYIRRWNLTKRYLPEPRWVTLQEARWWLKNKRKIEEKAIKAHSIEQGHLLEAEMYQDIHKLLESND